MHHAVLGSAGALLAACTSAPSAPPAAPTTPPAPIATSAPVPKPTAPAPAPTAASAVKPTTAPATSGAAATTTATVAWQTKPTGFYTLPFIAQALSTPFLDKLLTVPDDYGLQARLAEKWDVAPDAKSVTFHLRSGLKWSDGTPLTAKDIAFPFKSTMDTRT